MMYDICGGYSETVWTTQVSNPSSLTALFHLRSLSLLVIQLFVQDRGFDCGAPLRVK